ncbi:MAG: alpha/beta hydrolase, partial [Clostridiales bacterium]|nr:alpha/beta hydrolase [Clostridiales bacterium]
MSENQTYFAVKSTMVKLERRVQGLLHEPAQPDQKSGTGIIVMHSDDNYFFFPSGEELAKRGYTVLTANVANSQKTLDEKLLDVKAAVDYLRKYPGIKKVLLNGHSGGATLMTAYQNLAENGAAAFQGPDKIIKCSDYLDGLPAADGVMLLDANYGNAAMTLFSLDPGITNETGFLDYDWSYDTFDPANGYDPNGSTYSDEFVRKFLKGQGDRLNRLIDKALERLALIESGKGNFLDDEPFIVPGGVLIRPNNKLFLQDIRFLSHTKGQWPLIHKDGSITHQVVPSVRKPCEGKNITGYHNLASLVTTVRTFLKSYSVRTTPDFGYNEDSVYGVEWTSGYSNPSGNATGISVPLLMMGMTGSHEYLA